MTRKNLAIIFTVFLIGGPVGINSAVAQELKPPLKIVQLGDSYSAGNGARNAAGDRSYTGVEGCYRSPDNWGEQYANSLADRFAVTYVNRACSGGVISDITGKVIDQEVGGRKFEKKVGQLVSCPSPEYPIEESWERNDGFPRDICERTLRPQLEAVDESVDLVLMTGGGNDAEFATVVQQCFAIGYRDPGDCREAVNFVRDQLNPGNEENIEEKLVATFAELRARLKPGAKVVYVGYPYLVPDVGYRLRSLLRTDTFDAGDEVRIVGSLGDTRARSAVQRANAAAGEEFVIFCDDIKDLFEGPPNHLPNPDQSQPRNPDRWIWEFETRIPAEYYHYRPEGHEAIASLLNDKGPFIEDISFPSVSADVDLAFVVDTTGSMGGAIAQVRQNLTRIVDLLEDAADTYRVAVVSYRDFPERTGNLSDYPARVDQSFTNDRTLIQAGIDALSASGGGDGPETVFSGIASAIDLPWRPGVAKIAIVIGDAPPLSPEPISNLTGAELIRRSLAVDPVQIVGLVLGGLDSGGVITELATGTDGSVIYSDGDLPGEISRILELAIAEPFAWIGEAYAAKLGVPRTFDASGSYDPSGEPITFYEWDFDGDGIFDVSTIEPKVEHIYIEPFTGFAVLRVTGPGGTAIASARVVANAAGSAPQGEVPCEIDDQGRSIQVDDRGRPIPCYPTNLPDSDSPGVVVVSGTSVEQLVEEIANLAATLRPGAFRNKARVLKRAVEQGKTKKACGALKGIDALARAQYGKKVSVEDAETLFGFTEELSIALSCR